MTSWSPTWVSVFMYLAILHLGAVHRPSFRIVGVFRAVFEHVALRAAARVGTAEGECSVLHNGAVEDLVTDLALVA